MYSVKETVDFVRQMPHCYDSDMIAATILVLFRTGRITVHTANEACYDLGIENVTQENQGFWKTA
jgi:hypothetical protein